MTALALFISTFVLVFALGIQSLNVNNGHRIAAIFTSFFIGGSQMVLFKLAPIGIYAAMRAHPYFVHVMKKRVSNPITKSEIDPYLQTK